MCLFFVLPFWRSLFEINILHNSSPLHDSFVRKFSSVVFANKIRRRRVEVFGENFTVIFFSLLAFETNDKGIRSYFRIVIFKDRVISANSVENVLVPFHVDPSRNVADKESRIRVEEVVYLFQWKRAAPLLPPREGTHFLCVRKPQNWVVRTRISEFRTSTVIFAKIFHHVSVKVEFLRKNSFVVYVKFMTVIGIYCMSGWLQHPKRKSQFFVIFGSERWGGKNITIILENEILLSPTFPF